MLGSTKIYPRTAGQSTNIEYGKVLLFKQLQSIPKVHTLRFSWMRTWTIVVPCLRELNADNLCI